MKKLLIFDCDGVLIDSETLMARSWCVFLKQYFSIDTQVQDILPLTKGRSRVDIGRCINEKYGICVDATPELEKQKKAIARDLIRKELQSIPGAQEALIALESWPKCIGTGGSYEKTLLALEVTGLKKYFSDGAIFTRDMVENGKPAPDIFIKAAVSMGYEPKDCIVIEDAMPGIIAARAAGMQVVGYQPTQDIASEKLDLDDEFLFDDMKELPIILGKLSA